MSLNLGRRNETKKVTEEEVGLIVEVLVQEVIDHIQGHDLDPDLQHRIKEEKIRS